MRITCSQCNSTITINGGLIPKFCSECGASLSDSVTSSDSTPSDPTVAAGKTFRVNEDGEDQTIRFENRPLADTVTRLPRDDGTFADETISDDETEILENVGPYHLVRKIGQGGMGAVYEAVHQKTEQSVALKLLMPALRKTRESVHRFKRESQIAASINHPRSTFVYEAGEYRDRLYITMELMTGGTLKDVIASDGPLPVGRAVDYVLDIIDGLSVAHIAGIVHRDLKPSNCFLGYDGRVKIGDFGLAKSFMGDSNLTQTGIFMGTPQYAAPEQLRASEVDERADVYALGAVLFYLLAGQPPFTGNPAKVIASIASETPPRVSKFADGVPRELVRLISQLLEKDPNRRPQKLAKLRQALLPYSTRGASLADIGRRTAAFLIDLIVAGMLAGFLSQIITFVMMVSLTNANFYTLQTGAITTQLMLLVSYFAILENRWGRTLGKWLLGMRVIGKNSESPSLFAATLRAMIVPGLTWFFNFVPMAFLMTEPPSTFREGLNFFATGQTIGLLSWIPMLVCMISARQTNGYRGIHGLLSGTRVVRLSGDLEYQRLKETPVTVPVPMSADKIFGQYKAIARFTEKSVETPVYLGKDPMLDRDVWIFENPADPVSKQRRSNTRPNRLRVIFVNSDANHPWFVTEALNGVPLTEVILKPDCLWPSARPLFRELAIELHRAAEDGTLPSNLSLDQVWIDHNGRIKLLDAPIYSKTKSSVFANSVHPEIALFKNLLDRYLDRHTVPLHLMELQRKIHSYSESQALLNWVAQQLDSFADRPSTWKWDDRLGVMAISGGFEIGVVTTIVYIVGFISVYCNLGSAVMGVLATALASFVVFAMGYYFRGGVAFRVSGVAVLDKDENQLASKWRCGLRNWIAWLPLILLNTAFFFLLYISMEAEENQQMDLSFLMGLGLVMIPLVLMWIVGVSQCIAFPKRGIADLFTRTRLTRL